MTAWYADSKFSLGTNEIQFFHSEEEPYPWIRFQLNRRTIITSVTVHNRKFNRGERLAKLEVRAGLRNDLTNQILGRFDGPGKSGHAYVISTTTQLIAEFVSLQLRLKMGILQIQGLVLNEFPIHS